jgi:hypothetical protein
VGSPRTRVVVGYMTSDGVDVLVFVSGMVGVSNSSASYCK